MDNEPNNEGEKSSIFYWSTQIAHWKIYITELPTESRSNDASVLLESLDNSFVASPSPRRYQSDDISDEVFIPGARRESYINKQAKPSGNYIWFTISIRLN